MPTPTYTLIASNVVSASSSSVTFSSISSSYRDLVISVANLQASANGAYLTLTVNNDTGSNYNYLYMQGASAASSANYSSQTYVDDVIRTRNDNNPNALITFFDYAVTDKHKTFLIRSGNTYSTYAVKAMTGRWASTSAITSIELKINNGVYTINANTVVSLYGIVS